MDSAFERIYKVVEKIPRGKVCTYGQVARMAGSPRWARVVGYALHANPRPGVIPCHRVVRGIPCFWISVKIRGGMEYAVYSN